MTTYQITFAPGVILAVAPGSWVICVPLKGGA